ncbi:MAG TPA: ATP-binding protein [Pyrinomonadaceae bacterium]|jgi:PAS domain S-box-containing protein
MSLSPSETELQATLDKLRQSEQYYRALADTMPQIVWTADAEGSFDYYNRRWFEYTGMTPEQTLGWGWQPVLHPEDTERCLKRWAWSIKTGEDYEIEYRFRRAADGEYRWHLGRAYPLRDADGQITKWFGTSTDIHDHKLIARERNEFLVREREARKIAEEATRRLESAQIITEAALSHLSISDMMDDMLTRVREILHVDTVAILLVEKHGDELVAWAAKGLEEEVELGVTIPVGVGFAGSIVAGLKPIIIEDIDKTYVHNPLLREKGIKSLLGVPLMIEGRAIGVIHVGMLRPRRFNEEDTRLLQLIADRLALAIDHARLYEVERRARAEAEEANRLKDEFLTTLSHELRTPLTPIIGWIHMMRSGALGQQETEHGLAVIDKNSYALTRLINDLLDMSAIVSGKMQIERSHVPLAAVVQEAIETVRAESALRDVRIECVPFRADEAVMIAGDRTRLVQVFWNLLVNAVKFSDRGGHVRVNCETDERAARVHIEDEGEGISPDFLPFIFERFRQSDGSKTRRYGGLGIGLSLVKSFVEAHGGRVEATSAGERRGSHFTVHLPRLPARTQRPSRADPAGPAHIPPPDNEQVRALIIEDALDTLNMLQVVFELRGYEVTICQTPTEALRVAASMWFDIVISDIGMPDMDGYELLRRLRELPHLRDVPAVALTGYASKADSEAAESAGFSAHITKPIDPTELATRIDQLLKGRTSRQS